MRLVAHRPRSPLDEHVEYLWALSDTPTHARERIVPSGTLELVINLDADAFHLYDPLTGGQRRFRGAMVSGCYASAFEIDTRAHASILGVHFRPGGAARLLGAPPGALANTHVALDELWGRHATELREQLCAAPSAQRRFELLEHALLARLPADRHRPHLRAALVELERPGIAVGAVANALGLSRRRFIEIFTEDVGLPPKRYAMVRRFQRALAAATRSPAATWTRIALDGGYYDQAHLCRDWMALTGISPTALAGLRGIAVKDNHIAVGSHSSKTRPHRARSLR